MTSLKKQEFDMPTYLGHVHAIMKEFETLMWVTTNVENNKEYKMDVVSSSYTCWTSYWP